MSYFTFDDLRIASPCQAAWSGMTGDDTVRHCMDCKKNVYNLSMLTRAEANELIREKEGHLCVTLYRRRDGTALTSDCPKGLRAVRRQYLRSRAKFAAGIAAIVTLLGLSANSCQIPTSMTGVPAPITPDSLRVDSTHHGG